MLRKSILGAAMAVVLCSSTVFGAISVDGTIGAGEWDGFSWADATGTYTGAIGTAGNLSEHGGAVDFDMWGAKVENGVFYGMFRLNADALQTVASYDRVGSARIYLGYTIDVDPLNGTGKTHNQNLSGHDGWDIMLEIGVDNGGKLTDPNNPTAIGVWNDVDGIANWDVQTAIASGANGSYDGYVIEFKANVSDIIGAIDTEYTPVTAADNWLLQGRVDGAAPGGVGSWTPDFSDNVILMNKDGAALPMGDADLDGDVDGADLVTWGTNYSGSEGSGLNWLQGDFDQDGDVDGADLTTWGVNYTGAAAPQDIPEPMTLSLLTIGGAVLLRRRK